MVVLLVAVLVMGVGLRLVAGLLALSFFLLVLLLLFQLLFPLPDPHELYPPLLSTQDHYRLTKDNHKGVFSFHRETTVAD